MKLAVLKENRAGELRIAASPDSAKKLAGLGFSVTVETGAGAGASFPDGAYVEAGAAIAANASAAVADADVVLKVQGFEFPAEAATLKAMKKGALFLANLTALANKSDVAQYAEAGVTAFAMDLVPRITRAQSMDILSSQSNLAGYRAVIEAAHAYGRVFPMMMTAAGTVPPAKVFIMGAGVAGLQAVATAKRLGAVVTAYDVRPDTKEQVESLGGKFVIVDAEAMKNAQTAGGYAKEMSEDYKQKEKQVIAEHIKKQDIVVTTALIPGRPAPVLVTEEMVKTMRPGSVIVDLAVSMGGNCPLSKLDQIVVVHGVTIVGHGNMPSRLASDASALFAKNLVTFITPLIDKETKGLKVNWDDEIIKGTLVARDGAIVHPALTGEGK